MEVKVEVGKDCILELPGGNTTFRTTVVKPYLTPEATIEGPEGINTPPLPSEPDQYNSTSVGIRGGATYCK